MVIWTAISGGLSALAPRVLAKERPAAVSMRQCGTALWTDFTDYFCAMSYSENVLDPSVSAEWTELGSEDEPDGPELPHEGLSYAHSR